MNSLTDIAFVLVTLLVAAGSLLLARRTGNECAAPNPWPRATHAARWLSLAVIAFSMLRSGVVVLELQQHGIAPWAFLAVDWGTAIPYALAAPRLVAAMAMKRAGETVAWALCLLIACATGSVYLAVALQQNSFSLWYAGIALAVCTVGLAGGLMRCMAGSRSCG